MRTTGFFRGARGTGPVDNAPTERNHQGFAEKEATEADAENTYTPRDSDSLKPTTDSTHRKLKPRHIQLIGIGGTIGTALFVQIGKGLLNGGPASLLMAFTIW